MPEPSQRLQHALSDRYRIERELGRGGMATVFLAQDLKHPRRVAIKVLDPEVAAAIGPERFLREIETVARLSHPNILPLLDSGEAAGLLYYVMPYAGGESLRQRLEREKQLPLEDALGITREVADALDHAHRQGVAHRDIKPENILLEEGHAVVADFGIARAITTAERKKLTTSGVLIGTPAYMSPEQSAGSHDLAGQTDQYSLGCVLYEMLAGQPPFTGPTVESLAHQHLNLDPRPVTALRNSVPRGVERALARALAKTPADRFRTAGQFARALTEPATPTPVALPKAAPKRRRWVLVGAGCLLVFGAGLALWRTGALESLRGHGGTAAHAEREPIIVCAFEGPPDDAELTATVQALVSAAIDQTSRLVTIGNDEIKIGLRRAGKPDTLPLTSVLARELAVRGALRSVLEGRVDRVGGRYAVVVRLVDAEDGHVLLTEADEAASQDALIPAAARLATKLEHDLAGRWGEIEPNRETPVAATPSFEAYRKFVESQRLRVVGDYVGAETAAREALRLDPGFAVAWVTLGNDEDILGRPARTYRQEALRHADRLTPAQRLRVEAMVVRELDPRQAIAIMRRHTELYGEHVVALNTLSNAQAQLGLFQEALESNERAIRLSRFGPPFYLLINKVVWLLFLHRFDEARVVIPHLRGWYPQFYSLGLLVAMGSWPSAESLAVAYERDPSQDPEVHSLAAAVIAAQRAARGQVAAAFDALDRARSAAHEANDSRAERGELQSQALLALTARRPLPSPGPAVRLMDAQWLARDSSTSALVTRGFWEAVSGDTAGAARLMRRLAQLQPYDLPREGPAPQVVSALIHARAGDPQAVIAQLAPADQSRHVEFDWEDVPIQRIALRWALADAYEHAQQPDSAAACFEATLDDSRCHFPDLLALRMISTFVHLRLAELYERMGRPADAHRHWAMVEAACTQPDPPTREMLERARAALSAAAMSGRGASR